MIMNYLPALAFLLLFGLGTIQAQDNCPQNLLPSSADIKGWTQKTSPECFNNENLFEAINGAAEVYLEYGFVAMARSSYTRKKQTLDVEIYKMAETDAAYGILTNMHDGPPLTEVNGCITIMKSYYGMTVRGRYFIIITEPTGKGGITDEIDKFINQITGRIEEKAIIPDLITNLQVNNITRLIFFKGDLVLNNAVYFGMTRPFHFKSGVYFETKGIPVIAFQPNTDIILSDNIKNTLNRFKESGKFEIDDKKNTINNKKGVSWRVITEKNKILLLSDDEPGKETFNSGFQFWKN